MAIELLLTRAHCTSNISALPAAPGLATAVAFHAFIDLPIPAGCVALLGFYPEDRYGKFRSSI